MHHQKTVRLPIPEDACELARWLISGDLVDPDDILEFMRGDVVCLRGTARAFALRRVKDEPSGNGPRHIPYDPIEAERLAQLKRRPRPPMRLNDDPLVE